MMTETEVVGLALATALKNKPSSFGASEAKIAIDAITPLFPKEIDPATFGTAMARLGNHSALRQWAIAHGFIVAPDDALTIEVRKQIAEILAAEASELEENLKP